MERPFKDPVADAGPLTRPRRLSVQVITNIGGMSGYGQVSKEGQMTGIGREEPLADGTASTDLSRPVAAIRAEDRDFRPRVLHGLRQRSRTRFPSVTMRPPFFSNSDISIS
jgi:hypothetical protein